MGVSWDSRGVVRTGQTRIWPGSKGLMFTSAKLRRDAERWKTWFDGIVKGPNRNVGGRFSGGGISVAVVMVCSVGCGVSASGNGDDGGGFMTFYTGLWLTCGMIYD